MRLAPGSPLALAREDGAMKKSSKFAPEVLERAVRIVQEHRRKLPSTTPGLSHRAALQPERLTDQLLERRPCHPVEHVGSLTLDDVLHEGLALVAPPRRDSGTGEADDRQDVLTDGGERPPRRLRHHRTDLPGLRRGHDLLIGHSLEHDVEDDGEQHTHPPGQHGDEVDQVVEGAVLPSRRGLLATCSQDRRGGRPTR
jgi:hypothetical protein